MTLGTGLFVSALLLGFIQLFLQTRDRWRWGRITGIAIAVAVIIPGAAWGAFTAYNHWVSRPTRIKKFLNIAIGEPKEEVLFVLGKPAQKTDEDSWLYYSNNERRLIRLGFKSNSVYSIETFGESSAFINGIAIGDKYEKVVYRLGVPSFISRSKDNTSRVFNYRELGTAIGVTQGTVDYLAAYDGTGKLVMVDDPRIKLSGENKPLWAAD